MLKIRILQSHFLDKNLLSKGSKFILKHEFKETKHPTCQKSSGMS